MYCKQSNVQCTRTDKLGSYRYRDEFASIVQTKGLKLNRNDLKFYCQNKQNTAGAGTGNKKSCTTRREEFKK